MKVERVLIAYKKSPYQLYVQERGDPSVDRAIEHADPVALALRKRHDEQTIALERVMAVLDELGIYYQSCWRGDLETLRAWDLVVAVGGDGTLLDVAHLIEDETPLFGVNSDPSSSVGVLCAASALDFGARLRACLTGGLRPIPHARIRVRLDGEVVLGPCLNDLLFAAKSPADMSRLQLAVVPQALAEAASAASSEIPWRQQRGSGIWIATAAGSTAAIRSAGGRAQPLRSRRLQYLLREPYTAPHIKHEAPSHGFLRQGEALVMVSRMRKARLWADGPHRLVSVQYGHLVTVDLHPQPLSLVRTNYR